MRNAGRHLLALTCALMVLMVTMGAATSAHARTSSQYRIEGRGWGHGIGMSQYGAQGYALEGWTVEQIIQHYYQGSVLAPRPTSGPNTIRALLQSHLKPARLMMGSSGFVKQGPSTMQLAEGDIVEMRVVSGNLITTRVRAGERAELLRGSRADATIVPDVDGGVRTLFAGDYAGPGTAYRGTITGRIFSGGVSVVNNVPLESYLRGVVPDEMPPSWHPEALKAQAVAARSYALRSIQSRYDWFDVYSTTVSQVYGGVNAEEASTDAAIAATAGLVARVGDASGEVVHAFFFSTSGSKTAGNDEVWGSSPYTYLRSVRSPFEKASPYFHWRGSEIKRYTPRQLGEALGVTGLRSVTNSVYKSGYARDVRINSRSGGKQTERASRIQERLGLRSTYFRFRFLRVKAPNTARAGRIVTITGTAPRAGVTTLRLRHGSRKVRNIRLKPNKKGTWRIRTRSKGDRISVRLTRNGLLGPGVTVHPAS